MTRRLLWVLVAVVAATYVAMGAYELSVGTAELTAVTWALIAPSFVVGGVFLMVKRPGHRVGELLVLAGMAMLVIPTIIDYATDSVFARFGATDWMWAPVWLTQTLDNAGVVLLSALIVLLPDGRFRYPREPRFLAAACVVVAFPSLAMVSNKLVIPGQLSFEGISGVRSGLFIDGLEPFGPMFAALDALGFSIFLGAVTLLFMRYRAAPTHERKQLRWVLFAGTVGVIGGLIPFVLSELGVTPPLERALGVQAALLGMPVVLFPLSVVAAVMEPRWIDVDIVMRRSLVYGALSLAILLLYVGVAASLGVAAGALGLNLEVAVVLTVIIAIVFQPARRRLQVVADRWVFGARPTKYEAVTEFAVTIEQAVDPTELLPRLAETIRKAIRLTWVVAVLDDGTRAETGSLDREPALRVPVGAGDEHIGEIVCGPKTEGALDADEIQLVRTLAAQLGLAVMNARLAGRIVKAAELERRRIERNIHDGAQQELVALIARLGIARSIAAQGGVTPGVVDDLRLEAQRILSDLRELAQGIHPSVLSDGGILEAVEDRCARLPLDVSLESSEGLRARRFDDNIEGAAYFFVTESLANVLKHADATQAAVSVTYDDGRLLLGVVDDGRGFDSDAASDQGFGGIRDRIRALGGTVTVSSRPGYGTRVSASLPVGEP